MTNPTGEVLRDIGIQRAIDNANRTIPNWKDRAIEYLKLYPGEVFQAEEVRVWSHKNGLEKPPHGRAWGAVIVQAKKDRIIQFIGYKNVSNPKAHKTPASVWRRTL